MIKLAQPNQQWWWVQRVFPWLDEEQTGRLYESVSKLWIADPIERLKKEQEVYQQVLPLVKQQQQFTDRANTKNELFSKSLDDKKSQEAINFRWADFADRVKEQKGIWPTAPDKEVLWAFVKENPDLKDLVLKHINEWDEELLYELGLKEKPLGRKVVDTAKKAWVWALATVAWLWAMYAWGELGKRVSKTIYGSTIPQSEYDVSQKRKRRAWDIKEKPVTKIDTMIDAPMVQGSGRWFSRVGFMWSKTALWDQATARQTYLSKQVIDPMFTKMETSGIKADYGVAKEKIVADITKDKRFSINDKKVLLMEVDEIFEANWFDGETSMRNLDLDAQSANRQLPKKYPKWGIMSSETKQANDIISNTFRDIVQGESAKLGDDMAKAYKEYWHMYDIIADADKAAGRPIINWPLGVAPLSWPIAALSTPATTIPTKATYKLSEAMQYIPKKLRQATKNLVKSGKLKDILKQNLRETPAMLLYPQAEKIKEWIENKEMTRLETAISTLESGKMPTRKQDPIIYALVKDMTKEEALEQLTQLKSVRWANKKEFKDGLDYLLKIIETEAGDSFTPYMKKK